MNLSNGVIENKLLGLSKEKLSSKLIYHRDTL